MMCTIFVSTSHVLLELYSIEHMGRARLSLVVQCVVWYSVTCDIVSDSAVCYVIQTVLSVMWYRQCLCYVIQTVLSVVWYSITCDIVLDSAVCNVILTVLSVVWHKQCCLKCDIDSAVCCVIQCHMCCSNRECCLTTLKWICLHPRLHVSPVILYHITDSTVCITQHTALSVSHHRQHCLYHTTDSTVSITLQTALPNTTLHVILYHTTHSTVCITSQTTLFVSHNRQHCQDHITDSTV